MITKEQIDIVRGKIFTLTVEQLKEGKQLVGLDHETLACGQFLIKDRKQRGVHGTSSAIRILSGYQDADSREMITKLVNYLQNREKIEGKVQGDDKDELNIIKLSEQLYSLSLVNAAQANPGDYIKHIKEKLINSKINDKGWSYFINSKAENPELLPTAFAIMGLYSNGFNDFPKAISFMVEELRREITDPTSFAIIVFSLYVLVFKVDRRNTAELFKGDLFYRTLNKIFDSKFCVLDENIEQNVEYWNEEEHFYIRIPWQLYLIAILSEHSSWKFSKGRTQNILRSIFDSYDKNGGFKYKYSGNYLSTRTNAIVFDTWTIILASLRLRWLYAILNIVDRVRDFIGSKWIRYPVVIIMLIMFLFTIATWVLSTKTNAEKVEDLGPDTIVFILVLLYEFGRRSK